MPNILSLRRKVCDEARSWICTPYHHMGRVKGAGTDCAMLLAEVYARAGIVPHIEVEYYPEDWHLHKNVERFLAQITSRCIEVERPEPGDVVLFHFGKVYSHGAIVLDFPLLVHANRGARLVELIDADRDPHLSRRLKRRFFSPLPFHP